VSIILKRKIMKNLNVNLTTEIFENFVLSNQEMINVRGGEGEPIIKPVTPPVRI
jgi:hypothetical protein